MFGVPHVEGFFHLGFNDLRAVLRVPDNGVVEHFELLSANRGLENLRPFLNLVAEANTGVLAEELEE